MRIFVVEDHPIDRKLLRAVLQHGGHSLRERDRAEGAFEQIRADEPDIVLLDMQLPGANGMSLLRQLREDERTARIPVMAVTAYPVRFRRADVIAAGCDDCLIKPFDTRTLAASVNALLQRHLLR